MQVSGYNDTTQHEQYNMNHLKPSLINMR